MSRINRTIPWPAAIALALAIYFATTTGVLRREVALMALLPLALVGVLRVWTLTPPRQRVLLILLGTLSILLAVIPTWLNVHALPVTLLAGRLVVLCVGWAVVLWLPLEEQRTHTGSRWQPRSWQVLSLFAAVLVVLIVQHARMVGNFAVLQDEVLYVMQSSWLQRLHFGWRLDPELLPFFRPEYTAYRDGVLTTQYPPGWPALLALFSAVGLRWWSTIILALITVWFTYLLGRELKSSSVGFIAAALLGTQPWLVETAHGYMSHAASAATVTIAGFLLVRSETRARREQLVLCTIAGFALGIATAIRPLSGVAMAASLFLWQVVRGRQSFTVGIPTLVCLAAGALLPVAGLLHYNSVTNGSPFVFGYQAVHGHYHDLGFGMRGYRHFAGALTPTIINVSPFTLRDAIINGGQRLWEFVSTLLPFALLLPLLWLATVERFQLDKRSIAVFCVLPLAYFFYFFTNIRFYTELLPFVMLGVATMLVYLIERRRSATLHVLLPVILLGGLIGALSTRGSEHGRASAGVLAAAKQVAQAAERNGKVVVFVNDPAWEAYMFRRLSFFNRDGLTGDILVVRDRGADNALLLRRLPHHKPLRAIWDARAWQLRFVPFESP